ncbi:C2H2 type zinc finger domain protein [Phlyctema vagabunda]|uniref:C2H2 type zinc finger domain protein n=1 Tax=Phlyctema vagabunda TaxID=108571 RepID=A0ABR4PI22_9HELO
MDHGTSAAGSSNSRGLTIGRQRKQPKADGDASDVKRFQCPRCPKSFSRIENLTRHQANHDDVGKFVCTICRKRFTRSDLLNRHRKIHGSVVQSVQVKDEHVTDTQTASPGGRSQPSQPRGFNNLVHQDDGAGFPQSTGAHYPQVAPAQGGTYPPIMNRDEFQHHSRPTYGSPTPNYTTNMSNSPLTHNQQGQGLASLMEAALGPPENPAPYDPYALPPTETAIDPSLWDGFLMFGDAPSTYMGAYDADISWTLNFQSEGSPSYFDMDMLNPIEFDENPYQNAHSAYGQPTQLGTVNNDADDEDTNDWPDKACGPPSPTRHLPLPHRPLLPVSWQPVIEESRMSGIPMKTSALQKRSIQYVDDTIRTAILNALNVPAKNEFSQPGINDTTLTFPPAEALDYFLRLYIHHVHLRFPIIHIPTFDLYNVPPLLLASMMFLGSSHSKSDCGRFSRVFFEYATGSFADQQRRDSRHMRNIDNILTLFLLCLGGAWSGSKQLYEFAEGGRGNLITACRRGRLLDCRPTIRNQHGRVELNWMNWIENEKRKRLGLSIYIFDCQYPALFNCQPYVSKAETTNCAFPCPEEYYEAATAETWKILLGPADMPPSSYHLHALNCVLLHKWVKPTPPLVNVGEFGNIVLLYAIHTHIFEWRTSISMLNPTGLMGLGTKAQPIGEGLRERRKWLVDALDSWSECYQTQHTSIAASLLHRLGYISLDVSLSDMHLVGGRSASPEDGNFAEENLKYWANSEIATSTMTHVHYMLDICYQAIERGAAATSSYEIASCLFTGGMICWAYAKLKIGTSRDHYLLAVRKASQALHDMGCWRMCAMFGRILSGLEIPKEK